MASRAETIQQHHEPRPDPQSLTSNSDASQNASTGVDYEPHPDQSIKVSPDREKIVKTITSLYSGSASEEDMQVYAKEAVYDDPWSYCDTRYKIAGQWYGTSEVSACTCVSRSLLTAFSFDLGIPKVMASSKTLSTEIVSSTDTELVFKMKQEYTPRVVHFSKSVNSLVSLALDGEGKVKYHKDMWNEKDYSHEGLGKIMKTLNGDQLTKITRPPGDL